MVYFAKLNHRGWYFVQMKRTVCGYLFAKYPKTTVVEMGRILNCNHASVCHMRGGNGIKDMPEYIKQVIKANCIDWIRAGVYPISAHKKYNNPPYFLKEL